jgi:ABC-2 type transport system permease protein
MAAGAAARELARELGIYRRLAGARLRGQLQYRASFGLQIAGHVVLHGAEMVALVILFGRFDTLAGWELGEVAFLYGLSAIAFSLAQTVGSGFLAFSALMRQGGFDRVLTRPVAPLIQTLAADLHLHRLGRLGQGGVVFAYALWLTDVEWTAGRLLYLPVVVLSAAVLFLALFTLEATLCFWTTESTEVVNAFTYGGTTLAQYPLHVFDAWLRRLFLYGVPLGFTIYAPALYLLDRPDPLGLPEWTRFIAPLTSLAFATVAVSLWGVGVRHYRSTGT